MIKRFTQLSDEERRRVYEFVTSLSDTRLFFSDYEGFLENYTGPVFNGGKNHLTYWSGDEVKATVAMITKDIAVKNEAIITAITCRVEDLDLLLEVLQTTVVECEQYNPASIKLGLQTGFLNLKPAIGACGFKEGYEAFLLRYAKDFKSFIYQKRDDITFESLNDKNRDFFLEIHNKAFLDSPNGGQMTEEEMDNFFARCQGNPLVGVCYLHGEPAAMYELMVEDRVGFIESLGVHPDYQRRGLGRAILAKCIDLLKDQEIDDIKLIVISTNVVAFELYLKSGFELDRVISKWFENR